MSSTTQDLRARGGPRPHGPRHRQEGTDPLFDQNLNTADSAAFTAISVGDIVLKHGWRMFEREDGLYLEKGNKLFRIKLEEVRT